MAKFDYTATILIMENYEQAKAITISENLKELALFHNGGKRGYLSYVTETLGIDSEKTITTVQEWFKKNPNKIPLKYVLKLVHHWNVDIMEILN